jgi:hypothetical protein
MEQPDKGEAKSGQSVRRFVGFGAIIGAVIAVLFFSLSSRFRSSEGFTDLSSTSPKSTSPSRPQIRLEIKSRSTGASDFAEQVLNDLPVAFAGAIAGGVVGGFAKFLKWLGGLAFSGRRKRKKRNSR